MPRKRPVSVHRSRSILASWMAPLWRARLIAEITFSTSMERALTGLVRTSSKLRWSTVGVGGVILPEVLVAFLFCTTVYPPPEGGGVAAAAANVLWGGGGGGGALAARAWVAGFGTVGGGIGVGGGLDWALPPKGVGAFGGDGGGGGGGGAWAGTSGMVTSLDTAGVGGCGVVTLGLGTAGVGVEGGGGGGTLTLPQILSNSSCCWRDFWARLTS